jgi:hypothetical protein
VRQSDGPVHDRKYTVARVQCRGIFGACVQIE